MDIRGGCALDGMPISCSELQERMERGTVEQEYSFPEFAQGPPRLKSSGERGSSTPGIIWRTERVPIVSFGLGLFMTSVPVLAGGPVGPGNNNEGYYLDWRDDVFRGPQDPSRIEFVRVPLLNFKKLLQDTLAYSDCAEFMSKVIAKAGELSGGKNDPVSTDIMTLYGMVNKQARGGFQLNHEGPAYGYSSNGYERLEDIAGGGGAAWGAWGTNNITVWINQQSIPVNTTAKNRARVSFKYAEVALHELFHIAGKNGYKHTTMDASAKFFEPGLSFDQAMKKHCIPRENW